MASSAVHKKYIILGNIGEHIERDVKVYLGHWAIFAGNFGILIAFIYIHQISESIVLNAVGGGHQVKQRNYKIRSLVVVKFCPTICTERIVIIVI